VARKGKSDAAYGNVNYSVLQVVLLVMMLMVILGVMAFPYYVSPITSSGAANQLPYAILNLILVIVFLMGVYLLEERNTELGSTVIILGLVLAVIMVWIYYGATALKALLGS
jgi:hypothetical protein